MANGVKTFFDYVDRSGPCWLWTGGTSRGYGSVKRGGKQMKAHRVAYELFVEPIRPGNVVRHVVCHNPLCVKPDHLLQGTVTQNNADRRLRREKAERREVERYGYG